ncbi:MAG: cysteine desulfurase [bacterium]|nr:cysteine desulfurase [bacterium]
MKGRVYLDHNATTPLHPDVAEAMRAVLFDVYGNPSSTHAEGARARSLVDTAREQVAELVGAAPREIVFTAGATEANNTVVLGADEQAGKFVTTSVEHPSVEAPLQWQEARGAKVVRLPVDPAGVLDMDALDRALASPSRLVTIIWANNETGVIQPMHEIAERVKAAGQLLHVDATQAIGKAPVSLGTVPADFLSLSAHKFNGPKGVGCLVVRDGAQCAPRMLGGPQERRFRGGTENVAGIVGLGLAAQIAGSGLDARIARYGALRDRLWRTLQDTIDDVRRNGEGAEILCNTLNVEFRDVAGDVLLQALDLEGVAVSAGAACHSGSISPSQVLSAMGRTPEQALGSLRLCVGLGIDDAGIDRAASIMREQIAKVRAMGEPR